MVILTKNGALKVLDAEKAQLNVSNKRYVRKLGKLMKFKEDNDCVIFAQAVPIEDMKSSTLELDVFDNSLKHPKHVDRKIDLSKYAKRSDSATSAGIQALNLKDGLLTITNVNLKGNN